jgi:NitT/TauT family transport system permease protein
MATPVLTAYVSVRSRLRSWTLATPRRDLVTTGLSLATGLVAWETLGWVLGLPWLPPFSRVATALVELIGNGEILANLAVSLRTLATGFTLSLVAGLGVGVLMGRYRRVEQALAIYVNAMLFMPSLAFAPIYFAIFHLSDWTRIAVVVQFSVFFIVVNTAAAIRAVDPSLVEMATSYQATERQMLWEVRLPAALVLLFAGVRIGIGRAVKGMISGEMFIAVVGLGGVIQKYGTQFDSARVLAVTLVTLVLAVVLGAAVQALDRSLTRWAH